MRRFEKKKKKKITTPTHDTMNDEIREGREGRKEKYY